MHYVGNMAEDLMKLWGKFSIFEEESVGVKIEEDALADIVTKGKLSRGEAHHE